MDEDIKYCENCGSLMERAEKVVDFEFRSGIYIVTLEAYYCPKCDVVIDPTPKGGGLQG